MWSDFLRSLSARGCVQDREGALRFVGALVLFSSLHSLPGSSPSFFIIILTHHFSPSPSSLSLLGVESASDVPPPHQPPPQLSLSYFASPSPPPLDPAPALTPLPHPQFFLSMVLSLFLVIMVQITGGRAAPHLSRGGNPTLQIGVCL